MTSAQTMVYAVQLSCVQSPRREHHIHGVHDQAVALFKMLPCLMISMRFPVKKFAIVSGLEVAFHTDNALPCPFAG